MELKDYSTKAFFTPFELEHILQIPMTDVMELFLKVPKVREPRGCFEGDASRELIAKWARKRVYADLIARNAANAEPVIRRGDDSGKELEIALTDVTNDRSLSVRFPGDLRLYLEQISTVKAATKLKLDRMVRPLKSCYTSLYDGGAERIQGGAEPE